jgi:hypothetical protein
MKSRISTSCLAIICCCWLLAMRGILDANAKPVDHSVTEAAASAVSKERGAGSSSVGLSPPSPSYFCAFLYAERGHGKQNEKGIWRLSRSMRRKTKCRQHLLELHPRQHDLPPPPLLG